MLYIPSPGHSRYDSMRVDAISIRHVLGIVCNTAVPLLILSRFVYFT